MKPKKIIIECDLIYTYRAYPKLSVTNHYQYIASRDVFSDVKAVFFCY